MDSKFRAPRTPWARDVPASRRPTLPGIAERSRRTTPNNRRPRPRRARSLRRARTASAVIGLSVVAALALAGCSGYAPGSSVPAFDAAPSASATATPAGHADPTVDPTGGAARGSFDEFDGPAGAQPDPSRWVQQTGGGGWGNNELQTYSASNGVLDGKGHLAITADIGGNGAGPYTSARLTTHGRASFGYGTVSARIEFPDGESLLPSFWMLGSDVDTVGWPLCGEIDVVEAPSDTIRTTHFVHGPETGQPDTNLQAGNVVIHRHRLSGAFHTYSVTRSPGHLVIAVDGVVATDLTPTTAPSDMQWVFDGPFDVVLSMAVGGAVPAPTSASAPTSTMLVDWVRYAPAS